MSLRTGSGYFSKPAISFAEIVAGAPFFFGAGDWLALGDSLTSGVTPGLTEGDGDSSGPGVGVAELFRFFFLVDPVGDDSGDGLNAEFFFLDDALAAGVSDGVVSTADFFFGDADFSGAGEDVGELSAADFFFLCFRGVGVGVGAKIFLTVVPKESAAGAGTGAMKAAKPGSAAAAIAAIIRRGIGILVFRQLG